MPLKDDIWKGKEYERMHLFTASLMRLHKLLVHIIMMLGHVSTFRFMFSRRLEFSL